MQKQLISTPELLKFIPRDSICFLSRGRLENIPVQRIIHIYKKGTETLIRTHRGSYSSFHSLTELMRELPEQAFVRIHRSHIVSMELIRSLADEYLILEGEKIPFTDYYKRQLMQRLGRQLDQQYGWFSQI